MEKIIDDEYNAFMERLRLDGIAKGLAYHDLVKKRLLKEQIKANKINMALIKNSKKIE